VPDEHPRWELPNTGAADAYNFRAVPNGSADVGLGIEAYYWTATEYSADAAKTVRINTTSAQVMSGGAFKRNPYAVRLVKDDLTGFPSDGDTGTMEDREGNVYQAVRIGTQVWMAENLGTTLIDASTSIENIGDLTIFLDATTPAYRAINNDITFAFEFEGITLEHSPDGWDDGILNLTRNKTLIGITRSYTVKLKFVKEGAYFIRNIFYTNGVDADLDLEIWKLNRISMQYELIYIGNFDFETFEDTDNGVNINCLDASVASLIKSNMDTTYSFEGWRLEHSTLYEADLPYKTIRDEDINAGIDYPQSVGVSIVKLQDVFIGLIEKITENSNINYELDASGLDDDITYLTNGYPYRPRENPAIKAYYIKVNLSDLLKTIFLLHGLVLDIRRINNIDHVSLKHLTEVFDDTATPYEIGSVSNVNFKPNEDPFSKLKIGYNEDSDSQYTSTNRSPGGYFEYETGLKNNTETIDFLLPFYLDIKSGHYEAYKVITDTFSDAEVFMDRLYLVEALPIGGETTYEPLLGTLRQLSGDVDTYNLRLTPKRLLLKRLDYFSSLINKPGLDLKYTSGSFLSKTNEVKVGTEPDFTPESESITLLDPVYFKPFIFEFDTYIDEDFFETLSSNPATPISFEFEGNAYKGFLLDTKIKLHGKSKARIKLLSAASNDLTKLIR
jgi:hypothetical protein